MEPTVSLFGEGIRHLTSATVACQFGCGSHCRHEQENFKPGRTGNVIQGLNSNWIEENSVLAMARPSERFMSEVLSEFRKFGIASVVNLQQRGEHEHCAKLVDQGFTYKPETFMNGQVSYYNFPTEDFGIWPMDTVFDVVKVLSFALSEGGIAIHCHAGLGRTGVICACWLIFERGLYAEEAIKKVRATRPGSIQTRNQLASVVNFEKVFKVLRQWPNGEHCLQHIYKCQIKAFNKHEFGRTPTVPPFLLKVLKVINEKSYGKLLNPPMEHWIMIERIKNGFWFYLNYVSLESIEQLVRSWLGSLAEPLIDATHAVEYNQFLITGVQLRTAKVAYQITKKLELNKNEILTLLSHQQNVNEKILELLEEC